MSQKEDFKTVNYEGSRVAAMLLLQLAAQGEADFQEGRFLPQDEAFARVRARLQKLEQRT